MKTTKKRNNYFILALDEDTSEKLKKLAQENDHAPSKQAYILIRNILQEMSKEAGQGVQVETI